MAVTDATSPSSPHVPPDVTDPAAVAAFIARWSEAALSERAKEDDVREILETLTALGRLRRTDDDERWMR